MDEPQVLLQTNHNIKSSDLYEYCNNNPLSYRDSTGYIATRILSAITGAIISVLSDLLSQMVIYWFGHRFKLNGFRVNWWSVAWSGVAGLATGAFMVSNLKKKASVFVSTIIGLTDGIVSCIISKKLSLKTIFLSLVTGFVSGMISGAGVGSKYFRKFIFYKGGAYYYGKYYSSKRLLLSVASVRKDFANAVIKYCYGSLVNVFSKIVGAAT